MLEDLLLDEPRHVRRSHKADNGAAAEEGVSNLALSTDSLAASYFQHPTAPVKRSSIAHLRFGLHLNTFPASFCDTVEVGWDWRKTFPRQAASRARIISRHVMPNADVKMKFQDSPTVCQSAKTLSEHLHKPACQRTASVVTASGRGCRMRLHSIWKKMPLSCEAFKCT